MVFRERILTSLSSEEERLAPIATFPSTRSASTVGGVLNPSQATTYARSNFALPSGELLVEGAFFFGGLHHVWHLLIRILRSAPCSMNSGMASLSTVVKIGVSPSLLRRIQIRAKLQQLFFHIAEESRV
jgi:hypothetical protein